MANLDILHQRDQRRRASDERLRLQTLSQLHRTLAELIPGSVVWVYGSLLESKRFSRYSDIDIAIEEKPGSESIEYLQSVLTAATGRTVDIAWLSESRLAEKIRQTGSRWTV
jgi:predicted nucleotidyltransferase